MPLKTYGDFPDNRTGGSFEDRNPQIYSIEYIADDVAPHALVERASYVVPEGKVAKIMNAVCSIEFNQEPTSVDGNPAEAFIALTGDTRILSVQNENDWVDRVSQNVGQSAFLPTATEITIQTRDLHADGTWNYRICVTIVVYDATQTEE